MSAGRPRQKKPWSQRAEVRFIVDFSKERDVHSLLFSTDDPQPLVVLALREYIEKHRHPAGRREVQDQYALEALGLSPAPAAPVAPAPPPAAYAPAPPPGFQQTLQPPAEQPQAVFQPQQAPGAFTETGGDDGGGASALKRMLGGV